MIVLRQISKVCFHRNKPFINILRNLHVREKERRSFIRKYIFPPLRNEDNTINHWNFQTNVASVVLILYSFKRLFEWLEDPDYVLEEDAQEMERNGVFGTKKITSLDDLRREYRILLRKRQEQEKQPSNQD